MATLLIENAEVVATQDDARREIERGAVFVRDRRIERVDTSEALRACRDTKAPSSRSAGATAAACNTSRGA